MYISSLFIISLITLLIEYPVLIKIIKAKQIHRFKTMMWIGVIFYLVKAFSIAFVITLFGNQGSPFQLKVLTNSLILMGFGSRLFVLPYFLCFAILAYILSWQRSQDFHLDSKTDSDSSITKK